ncbi:transcriptional regulator, ArsR family [Longilinea arvoryzae]|uniref:Transcriptional regulator, ArsR family n=1 Tax=Longilinea arvoryzae TaxID=360412 RepID=A0A0S7BHQ6_9CHLR|nr:transcriptional regulator [Longilinea arvoryzae]GAP13066.1 transcriptional regulator, ArsR family [Longilinea arvoryzae]
MANEQWVPDLSTLNEIDRLVHEPARLMLMAVLYVVESADFIFLMNQTGMTWGNLSAHMSKLEEAGYVKVEKTYKGRRPNTILQLTPQGRDAFRTYRKRMLQVLDDLPE